MNDMQNNNSTSEAYGYLDKSPMFKFSLSSKELFHSNFLEWLYNVDKDKFKNLIQEMAGLTDYKWPDNWLVKREYNNFDLCIVEPNAKNNGEETEIEEGGILEEEEDKAGDNDNNNEDGNFRILFVIENKVKSIPYREQLIRYAKEANSINESYWKSIGKDVLAKNGYKEGCIVVEKKNEKKYWVLKRGKYREGRRVNWYTTIELIPAADNRKEGNSCVKNFLIDLKDLPDRKNEVIELLKKYDFKEYQIDKAKGKWLLKEWSYTEGKKNQEQIITLLNDVETEKDSGSGITAFLNDFASVQSKSCPVYYILLSLASKFPGGNIIDRIWQLSEGDNVICDWHVFYYSDYYKSIRTHFKISDDSTDLNGLIIQDYCTFLENLTNLVTVWQQDYEDYEDYDRPFLSDDSGNYKDAKKHRIHDLYQKLKFSYLCAYLFNEIKSNYQKQYQYTVYPSNRSGLFKEKKDSPWNPQDNYICVNYTYLHGAPLLEINIHPKCDPKQDVELYYAIQVQGNAYEKGIQVKKNEVAERKLNHSRDANFSTTIWDSLKKNTIELKVKNWMDINTTKEKPFNKYDMSDGSYIYQKEILDVDITINQVINRMLDDLGDVV